MDEKWKNGQIYHNGHDYKVWDSYGLSQYQLRSGSFSEDARGRWYLNIVVPSMWNTVKANQALE